MSRRCQPFDYIKGWRLWGAGEGLQVQLGHSQADMQYKPGKAILSPAPASPRPSMATWSNPSPWLCLLLLVLGLLSGGKPGSLPPLPPRTPPWPPLAIFISLSS